MCEVLRVFFANFVYQVRGKRGGGGIEAEVMWRISPRNPPQGLLDLPSVIDQPFGRCVGFQQY